MKWKMRDRPQFALLTGCSSSERGVRCASCDRNATRFANPQLEQIAFAHLVGDASRPSFKGAAYHLSSLTDAQPPAHIIPGRTVGYSNHTPPTPHPAACYCCGKPHKSHKIVTVAKEPLQEPAPEMDEAWDRVPIRCLTPCCMGSQGCRLLQCGTN